MKNCLNVAVSRFNMLDYIFCSANNFRFLHCFWGMENCLSLKTTRSMVDFSFFGGMEAPLDAGMTDVWHYFPPTQTTQTPTNGPNHTLFPR